MYRTISDIEPDWSREHRPRFGWHPSRSLLATIRDYQRATKYNRFYGPLCKKYAKWRHIFWSIVTGADIPIECRIGGGLLIPHPNGIVIHPDVVIGPNCLIFQQVTIGVANGHVPSIGGHVDIGAGAKILGQCKIGNHSQIGANAVVTIDVPEGRTAVGVPAKLTIPKNH